MWGYQQCIKDEGQVGNAKIGKVYHLTPPPFPAIQVLCEGVPGITLNGTVTRRQPEKSLKAVAQLSKKSLPLCSKH